MDLALSRILLSEIRDRLTEFKIFEIFFRKIVFLTKYRNIVLINVFVCPCVFAENRKSQEVDQLQIVVAVTDFWKR